MLSKLLIKQLKYAAYTPPILVSAFVMPIAFYALLPGFGSPLFPGYLIWFVVFALHSGEYGNYNTQVTLDHFPVTWRDHTLALFMFQGLAVVAAGLYAAGFMWLAGRLANQVFPALILPKSMPLVLFFAGITVLLSLLLPRDVARMLSVATTMGLTLLLSFNAQTGPVFLPSLSLPMCLVIGLGGFFLCLLLALKLPRTAERRPA